MPFQQEEKAKHINLTTYDAFQLYNDLSFGLFARSICWHFGMQLSVHTCICNRSTGNICFIFLSNRMIRFFFFAESTIYLKMFSFIIFRFGFFFSFFQVVWIVIQECRSEFRFSVWNFNASIGLSSQYLLLNQFYVTVFCFIILWLLNSWTVWQKSEEAREKIKKLFNCSYFWFWRCRCPIQPKHIDWL